MNACEHTPYGECEDCNRERIRRETDPKLQSIQFDLQAISSRDAWTKNGARAKRILAEREEKRDGLTDLRYGRRVSAESEAVVLDAANHDGIKPKGSR